MPKTATKPTVAQLHKRLQPIFNHYIRLRDTGVVDGERVGMCISCYRVFPYAELQGGHFVPAHKYFLKYDEENVNAQCMQCNGFRKGNVFGYMIGLVNKIGMWETYELLKYWNARRVYTVKSLTEAIEYYKGKVEEME
jgi:hypothetical protein